jgi:hypothetical protein
MKMRMSNIIIIDWDDTLYPTTWMNNNKINLRDNIIKEKYMLFLKDLDKSISNLLRNINKRGDIYIITNASISWIDTCLKTLPNTDDIIRNGNIRKISARDIYQNKYPAKEWKIITFGNLIKSIMTKINNEDVLNIISLGDADYEYNALINLENIINRNKYLLKSIKFISKPEYNYILDQLHFINNNHNNIINKIGFIDLIIDVK